MKSILNHSKLIYLVSIVMFFPLLSIAQDKNETGEIEEAEIVIRKDRKITLPAAIRNFEKIPQLPLVKAPSQQTYQFKSYNYGLKALSPSFKPVGLRMNEAQKEITANYVKAGYGNYTTPYLEAYFGSLRSEDYVYNTYVRHLSSKTGPVFDENSGNGDTEVIIGGKYFNQLNTISGSLNYTGSKVHFYGYNPVLELDAESIERKYTDFSASLGIEKTNKMENGTYHFNTNWSFFKDNLDARENNYQFDLGIGYNLNEQMAISIQGIAAFSKREDAIAVNRNYFNLRPRVTYSGDIFTVSAGINIADDNDVLPAGMEDDEALKIFPSARVTINPNANVSIYAGYEGDLEMNTFKSFASEMPFLEADFLLYNTEKTSDIFAGVEADLTKGIRLNAGFSIASLKRLPFFTNSISDSTRFEVLYDTDATDRVNVFGEVVYEKPQLIRSSLRLDFYNYKLATIVNPYHKPQFKATANITAHPIDKLTLSMDAYFIEGLYGLNRETNVETNMDDIIDLNFQGTYSFTEQIGMFLQLNNVFGKEYERFLNYSNRGIQFLAGVSISF
jgi:hypothetical protein